MKLTKVFWILLLCFVFCHFDQLMAQGVSAGPSDVWTEDATGESLTDVDCVTVPESDQEYSRGIIKGPFSSFCCCYYILEPDPGYSGACLCPDWVDLNPYVGMHVEIWGYIQPCVEDGSPEFHVTGVHLLTDCDSLYLRPGWQLVSTNIEPDPSEIESVFADCWDALGIVVACDGRFCIPAVGCWIDSWDVCESFKVHFVTPCTVRVCGLRFPADKPCPLSAGWNCIAYLPECPLEPETALVSIWDNLNILINDAGEFCIPGFGCWIECMESNEGYKVHLSSPDTLIYPTGCPPCPPTLAKKYTFPGFAQTSHFDYPRNTGESYSIVVNSVELDGRSAEAGDEVGVFAPSGLCVGAGVWEGEILGLAAWQDDNLTETVDGFKIGEQMIFKLWNKCNDTQIELEPCFEKGKGEFGDGPYAVVSLKGSASSLPKTFSLSQNYPNPFNPTTVIKYALPVDCHVKVTIYNILGQKVRTLVDDDRKAGSRKIEWDGTNYRGEEVAGGIYFFRIEAGEHTENGRMVLIK